MPTRRRKTNDRSRNRPKRPKKLSQAKLLQKFEGQMGAIIKERDGHACQIAGFRHVCKNGLQVDHRPAKRGKHITFYDPRNLTTVCGSANFLAEHDPAISHAIIEVVKKREGVEAYDWITQNCDTPKRWYEEDILAWIENCRSWFLNYKNGAPLLADEGGPK